MVVDFGQCCQHWEMQKLRGIPQVCSKSFIPHVEQEDRRRSKGRTSLAKIRTRPLADIHGGVQEKDKDGESYVCFYDYFVFSSRGYGDFVSLQIELDATCGEDAGLALRRREWVRVLGTVV